MANERMLFKTWNSVTVTYPKALVKFQVLMEKSPILQLSVGPDQKN